MSKVLSNSGSDHRHADSVRREEGHELLPLLRRQSRYAVSVKPHDRTANAPTVRYGSAIDRSECRLLAGWRRSGHGCELALSTQSGPDASAQSVGRVARLSRNVRQPKCVLANEIAGHKAERRPGAGEEWRASTKHEGAEIKSILVNKANVGQAFCQPWSGNRNLPRELRLQPAYRRLDVSLDECGVRADGLQR